VNEIYEALQAKEKMKQMVSFEGSASNGEALKRILILFLSIIN
jgi:hypothetical protein